MNLSYLIGVMLGDGGVYGNTYVVFCRDPNREFAEYIAALVRELFGIEPRIRLATSRHYLVSTNNRKVHDFFVKLGFPKGRKLTNAMVPRGFERDIDVLKGLFDSEGYCGVDRQVHGGRTYEYPYVGIEMISKPLIKLASMRLDELDIRNSYRRKKPHAWGKHFLWRLTIKGREHVEAFRMKVGFRHPDKSRKLEEILRA